MNLLVQQFFLEKAGRVLKPIEMNSFITDNLLDVEKEGFDIRTGHGLFRLPKPETIKISDYAKDINVPSKWIPVAERLPEPFEVVLVYDDDDKCVTEAYMTRHREWVGIKIKNAVTHWMPLPEPPKGE